MGRDILLDSTILRSGVKDATNQAWCWASVSIMLASWIVLFSLWSRSQRVLPGSITISLNPIINCFSDFSWLNSLFNAFWISTRPALRWSLESLIYQVNAQSCSGLTKVAFLMLSSTTPCPSQTTLTMNQNYYGSSLPTTLNIGNLIVLAILDFWFGGRCAKANYEPIQLLIHPLFNPFFVGFLYSNIRHPLGRFLSQQ